MSHSTSQTRLLTLFQDNKLDVPHQTSFPLDTLLMHYIRESVSSVLIYEAPIQAFQLLGKTQLLSFWKKEKIPSPLVSHRFLHSLSLSLSLLPYIHNLLAQTSCSLLYPVHDDLTGCGDAPVAHMRFAEKRCHHRAAAGLHQPPKITRAAPVKRGREEGQHIYEHNVPRMDHRLAPNPSPPPPLRWSSTEMELPRARHFNVVERERTKEKGGGGRE